MECYIAQELHTTDFEAPKLRNGRSGIDFTIARTKYMLEIAGTVVFFYIFKSEHTLMGNSYKTIKKHMYNRLFLRHH